MNKVETIIKPNTILKITNSIGVNEQKLLNIIMHQWLRYMLDGDKQKKITNSLIYEVSIKRFYLHKHLDKDRKFRLSFYTKKLQDTDIKIAPSKKHDLIKHLSIDIRNLTMQVNPYYNKALMNKGFFYLDSNIHRLIKKKSSLMVYEIVMFKLNQLVKDVNDLNTNEYRIFISDKEYIDLLGRNSYSHVSNTEIQRSVNTQAFKELNELPIGFSFVLESCGTFNADNGGFLFLIKITNQEQITQLLDLN